MKKYDVVATLPFVLVSFWLYGLLRAKLGYSITSLGHERKDKANE